MSGAKPTTTTSAATAKIAAGAPPEADAAPQQQSLLVPPVVNIAPLIAGRDAANNARAYDECVRSVDAAARTWGFFQVTNHGVSEKILGDFDSAMRNFFALPSSIKTRIKRTSSNSRGWFDDELTKLARDWKE